MSKNTSIESWNIQINRIGEPRKCNHCNEIGHIRKECTSRDQPCSIFKSNNRLAIKCLKTYANSGSHDVNEEIANNDENIT